MNVSSVSPSPRLWRRLWQAFGLSLVEKRVAGRSVRQSHDIRTWFEQASEQHEIAGQMLVRDQIIGAAEHALGSAQFYLRAWVASHDPTFDGTGDERAAWNAFAAVLRQGEVAAPPAALDAALGIASGKEIVDLDLARHDEIVEKVDRLLLLLDWLRRQIEPRSLVDVRAERWRRKVGLGVVAAALVVLVVARVLAPTNLAYRRPVLVSSTFPGSTAPEGGLTDGITDEGYGVATAVEPLPWVMVDLVTPRSLTTIKVYNRGDGWFDAALPMTLEISDDAQHFTEIEVRTKTFSQSSPWQIKLGGRAARYVRVKGKADAAMALSEIEVYGK